MNFLEARQLVLSVTHIPGKLPLACWVSFHRIADARAEECKEVKHPMVIKPESTWSKCPNS